MTEGAVYKGSSTSRKLFELVLPLKILELECGMRVNFFHITGTQMIDQGTDALSRLNILEDFMLYQSMLSFSRCIREH